MCYNTYPRHRLENLPKIVIVIFDKIRSALRSWDTHEWNIMKHHETQMKNSDQDEEHEDSHHSDKAVPRQHKDDWSVGVLIRINWFTKIPSPTRKINTKALKKGVFLLWLCFPRKKKHTWMAGWCFHHVQKKEAQKKTCKFATPLKFFNTEMHPWKDSKHHFSGAKTRS